MKKGFKIHFIGVGGISMSSLAKFFNKLGFEVSGSDIIENENLTNFLQLGISVRFYHSKSNVIGKDVVVYNSAIKEDNEELIEARKKGIVVYSRVELIKIISSFFNCKIGVSGCHGKTTATCMISNVVKNYFTFYSHIGGEDLNLTNCFYDGNDIFLTEVCEYAKNINAFTCDIAVCLNVGFDHQECYKDFNEIILAYYAFLDRADTKIVNNDDIYLNSYTSNNKITFGIDKIADYIAKNIKLKNGIIYFDLYNYYQKIFTLKIKGYCKHNVYNALSAVCVGKVLGLKYDEIKKGIENFNGVARRMEKLAKIKSWTFFADYAHHPDEIYSTLQSVDKTLGLKNVLIVFQPHTYSRTKNFINEFLKVFYKLNPIIYKTYPARETESQGYCARYLAKLLNAKYCNDEKSLYTQIKNTQKKVVLFMGAGDIYLIAKKIIKSLC